MIGARTRWLAAAATLAAAAAVAGCGLGPGESSEGEATLTVTRDYGAEPVLEDAVPDPPESETVIRMLDEAAEIQTRFGGGFVHSIEGIAGELSDGRRLDWFFYVNGIESSAGAAEVPVRGGDRIWWDYRDWTDTLRVPAVVGSWPEPFAQTSAGAEGLPVRVVCAGERPPCAKAVERLAAEGVDASLEKSDAAAGEEPGDALRMLVGPWEEIRDDPPASLLSEEPEASGVFARFARSPSGAFGLVGLDDRLNELDLIGPDAGLVAALRDGEDPPTWVVTGTGEEGVEAAAELLTAEVLADSYAVATVGGSELALPVERR